MINLVKMHPIMDQASGEDVFFTIFYADHIDELADWCHANCKGVWHHMGTGWDGHHVGEVVFTHKKDAMFFKLAFGGK